MILSGPDPGFPGSDEKDPVFKSRGWVVVCCDHWMNSNYFQYNSSSLLVKYIFKKIQKMRLQKSLSRGWYKCWVDRILPVSNWFSNIFYSGELFKYISEASTEFKQVLDRPDLAGFKKSAAVVDCGSYRINQHPQISTLLDWSSACIADWCPNWAIQ